MELVEEVEEVAVEQVELGLSTCWRREGSPDTAALARQFYFQSQAASPIIPPTWGCGGGGDGPQEVARPSRGAPQFDRSHRSARGSPPGSRVSNILLGLTKISILLFIWLGSLSTSCHSYCHNKFQCHHHQWLSAHEQDHTWPANFSTSSLSRPNAVFSSFTCLLFTTCRGLKALAFD